MAKGSIDAQRILGKLDELLGRNDYLSAERHLLYWQEEAISSEDMRTLLLIKNELAGLYRKLSRKEDAFNTVSDLLVLIDKMEIENNVGAATTYLNCATVYKAFGEPEKSLPLFEKAKNIYENNLSENDERFGGLFNNMALSLVDLKRFDEAYDLYDKAISVMKNNADGDLEVAITYLNIANAKETQLGAEESENIVRDYLEKAIEILDNHENKDGYYAFVCEKCSSVFGYFGYFLYKKELDERVRKIYEGS